jgi:hypothetical protein
MAAAPEPAPKAPPAQTAARPPAPPALTESTPSPPPETARRTRETATRSGGPIPLRPGSSIPRGGPPIDATDLPPLEGSGSRTYDAPSPQASAPRTEAGSSGATATAAAASGRSAAECRPYVADTTITGSARPVSGLACRQPDGRWKLVTERPMQ